MMPLNHKFRKCIAGYKLSREQEKDQSSNEHGWLFARNENEQETLIHTVKIYSQDIAIEFCIEKCDKLVIKR